MKSLILFTVNLLILLTFFNTVALSKPKKAQQTVVTIEAEKFLINGEPTYKGRTWQGYPIEGLLMNSRMVQGVFDDLNPETAGKWKYPDTGKWDADRNTSEFIAAMDDWYAKGLLAFNIHGDISTFVLKVKLPLTKVISRFR